MSSPLGSFLRAASACAPPGPWHASQRMPGVIVSSLSFPETTPPVEWQLKQFYREAYFKNPKYLVRRFRFMMRNHEVALNVYYTIKFWLMLGSWKRGSEPEAYAYEDRWRPLDLQPDEPLSQVVVPIVRRRGTALAEARRRAAAAEEAAAAGA